MPDRVMNPLLEVIDASVGYHGHTVVHDASFQLAQGTIGCLLGPSGCGKTTLLRAIAGFEPLQTGMIRLNAKTVSQRERTVPPENRLVGMVFQDFALFPHLNVSQNIAFGIRHWSTTERQHRIHALLNLMGLKDYSMTYPHQLSGGQQQRVALARALAPKPDLLLLDEPFSSMDVELREGLAQEVRSILRKEHITAILVTHDQLEAFAMADEIGVINNGTIMQWDTGYNLYHRPVNRFVADFVGQGVLLSGKVVNAYQLETELGKIDGKPPPGCQRGCPVDVLIRPDDVVHDDRSNLKAKIVGRAFRGAEFLYSLLLPSGSKVLCLATSHDAHDIGEQIGIRLDLSHLVVFPRDSKL